MIEWLGNAFQLQNSLEETLISVTKENEIHINEAMHSLKKGHLYLDEYVQRFKALNDELAAMKRLIDDLTKV